MNEVKSNKAWREECELLRKQVAELREALVYHQDMTRPITKTFEALARTAKEE